MPLAVAEPFPQALPLPARLRPADLSTLLGWHARFAGNPSLLAALPAMTHLLSLPGVPGGLGLQRVSRVLVAGEPLAPQESWPALTAALLELAGEAGMVVCFAPTGAAFAAVARKLGLETVRLGSTPYIHLTDWPQRGNAGASIRHARNRARRDGVVFGSFDPAHDDPHTLDEVRRLAAAWLGRRRAGRPFHWIFSLQPLAQQERKRYFLARQGAGLVGMIAASPLPARGAWYLEDIVLAPAAPAQVGTALVAYALTALKDDGVPLATLGGVPLSRQRGDEDDWEDDWEDDGESAQVTPLEALAYRLRPLFGLLYSFDGLELFKRRFGPAHWENEYLALPRGWNARLQVCAALARLVLRGR